jgi:hypothetical protein
MQFIIMGMLSTSAATALQLFGGSYVCFIL